jgi:hypothetical protein
MLNNTINNRLGKSYLSFNRGEDFLEINQPTVQIQQSFYNVNSGSSVTLVCSVSSSLAITSVQWQRNIGGSVTTINSNTNTNKYMLKGLKDIVLYDHS